MAKSRIFAVDFDGTLHDGKYPRIGMPYNALIQRLIDLRNKGDKVILWTCRDGDYLDIAVDWCRDKGLEFDAVNENVPEIIDAFGGDCRKIFANYYIDDLAIRPEDFRSIIR